MRIKQILDKQGSILNKIFFPINIVKLHMCKTGVDKELEILTLISYTGAIVGTLNDLMISSYSRFGNKHSMHCMPSITRDTKKLKGL